MLTYPDISGNGGGVGFVKRNESIHQFTTIGGGPEALVLPGSFNVALSGSFVANMKLQRSYDDGLTWRNMTALGSDITFTGPCEEIFAEPETGVLYRWYCSTLSAGNPIGRISQ